MIPTLQQISVIESKGESAMIEVITAVLLQLAPPKVPPVRYYEPGKACYIEGVFHEDCPGAPQ